VTSVLALIVALALPLHPDAPAVGARAQAYIAQEARTDQDLRASLEAYMQTMQKMMEQKDNSEVLGVLIRHLEQHTQCVEDLVGAKEQRRLTDGVQAELIDRKQIMKDWLTVLSNLPEGVMNEPHEIVCGK
jgi:hypothetical protein